MTAAIRAEVLRFLLAGALNTAASYVLYLALLRILSYTMAYTIAFCVGIASAYLLNTRFVFRVRQSARSLLTFPLVYLAQYLTGLVVLELAVKVFRVPQDYAMFFCVAVTVPMTFVLSRSVLASNAPEQPSPEN